MFAGSTQNTGLLLSLVVLCELNTARIVLRNMSSYHVANVQVENHCLTFCGLNLHVSRLSKSRGIVVGQHVRALEGPVFRLPLSEGCLTGSFQVGAGSSHTQHATRNAGPQASAQCIVVRAADDVDARVAGKAKEPDRQTQNGEETQHVHGTDALLLCAWVAIDRGVAHDDGSLHDKGGAQVDLEDASIDGAVDRPVADGRRSREHCHIKAPSLQVLGGLGHGLGLLPVEPAHLAGDPVLDRPPPHTNRITSQGGLHQDGQGSVEDSDVGDAICWHVQLAGARGDRGSHGTNQQLRLQQDAEDAARANLPLPVRDWPLVDACNPAEVTLRGGCV